MEESRFRWEEEFKNTWDSRKTEHTSGVLRVSRRTETVQRGIVRKVLLLVDLSSAVEERDFLPSRKFHLKRAAQSFYRSFTESNPLSTVGLMVASEGVAYLASSIISSEEMVGAVIGKTEGAGKFSLTAALESAAAFFEGCSYLKEIVLIVSSISFFGRSPYLVINSILGKGIKVHAIHFCAELEILKRVSEESEGVFGVVERPEDLAVLLDLVSVPGPYAGQNRLAMLEVGFPKYVRETSLCACHFEMTEDGYVCPFCTTKVCAVAGACPICEGILSAPVHLLKALHWTDSAPEFASSGPGACQACGVQSSSAQECPVCKSKVCVSCSTFIRQELNFCIFCDKEENRADAEDLP